MDSFPVGLIVFLALAFVVAISVVPSGKPKTILLLCVCSIIFLGATFTPSMGLKFSIFALPMIIILLFSLKNQK